MFKQRQAGDPFGASTAEDGQKRKPLSLNLPNVHDSMRLAGVKDVVPSTKTARVICCCGSPGCGIGPMTKVEEP